MSNSDIQVFVINDLDPNESKGAASISFYLASRIFTEEKFAFLCTSKKGTNLKTKGDSPFLFMPETFLDIWRDKIRSKLPFTEGILRICSVRKLWRISRYIKEYSPRIIWVHQIGWRIPITALLLFKLCKIPVIFTVHDYTYLRFRKLYLHDFQGENDLESSLLAFHKDKKELGLKLKSRANLWQRLTRWIIQTSSSVVYISQLQSRVYRSAGFPSGRVINNCVKPCGCLEINKVARSGSNKMQILFAGRFIGKGLERVAEAVRKSDCAHLHLAGSKDLLQFAQKNLCSQQFTYHGALEERALLALIHQVDVTAVASNCFDVFPTITMESLAHGTPVFSTPTTGNFDYVQLIHPLLGLSLDQPIDLDMINVVVRAKEVIKNMQEMMEDLRLERPLEQYREVFRR